MPPATAAPGITFEFADPQRTPVETRTDIVGFVGLTERGPFHRAVRLESWHQYESVFGGLRVAGFLPLSVHGFFANGGMTCDVVRALVPPRFRADGGARHAWVELTLYDGHTLLSRTLRLIATSPGRWANGIRIEVIPRLTEETGLLRGPPGAPDRLRFRVALIVRDRAGTTWRLADCSLDPDDVRYLPSVIAATPDLPLRLGSRHTGAPNEETALRSPWPNELPTPPTDPLVPDLRLSAGTVKLCGGRDGIADLTPVHLHGDPDSPESNRWGLQALVDTDDVAMIAIPDAVPFPPPPRPERRLPPTPDCRTICAGAPETPDALPEEPLEYRRAWTVAEAKTVADATIRFCTARRDCVALLDPPAGDLTPREVQEYRASFDSSFGGLYWPWLLVPRRPRAARPARRTAISRDFGLPETPVVVSAEALIAVPPSGLVAGLTAAADLLVGPHRAPAGQTARGAIATTFAVDDDDHGSLNARGINVLRERPGRGVVLEGTRSLTLDQGPKDPLRHLNVRRVLLAILEAIDERTQWAVFEPNDHRLWADLRDVIRSYLTARWRRGWLSGLRPEEAFRVQCDAATNPPESLAQGYVVAEVGLRLPPPIEWIVVRIGRSAAGVEVLDADRA
jgi:hypothetical protein